MTSEEALAIVVGELEAAAIPYVIVDSFASNVHGEARATHDLDVVIAYSLQLVCTRS